MCNRTFFQPSFNVIDAEGSQLLPFDLRRAARGPEHSIERQREAGLPVVQHELHPRPGIFQVYQQVPCLPSPQRGRGRGSARYQPVRQPVPGPTIPLPISPRNGSGVGRRRRPPQRIRTSRVEDQVKTRGRVLELRERDASNGKAAPVTSGPEVSDGRDLTAAHSHQTENSAARDPAYPKIEI